MKNPCEELLKQTSVTTSSVAHIILKYDFFQHLLENYKVTGNNKRAWYKPQDKKPVIDSTVLLHTKGGEIEYGIYACNTSHVASFFTISECRGNFYIEDDRVFQWSYYGDCQ